MPLPPGSKTPPPLQLFNWIQDPLEYLETGARRYGSFFTAHWSGMAPYIIVSDPEAMQTMLTHPNLTAPGDVNGLLRPLVGDRSLLLLNDPEHRQRRKLLMPPFHGDRMVQYGQLIQQITEQIIGQWSPLHPFNVRHSMQAITLQVILQVVFGLRTGERLEKLQQFLVTRLEMTATGLGPLMIFLTQLQQDWGRWSPWGRIMEQQRVCDSLIYAEIGDRRAHFEPERIDILSLLLSARDEQGEGMSDLELRDELITLLFAGHETTATALTWALYWIHKQPQVYERLIAELDSVGHQADPLTLFKLPYLTAVCNETLRIYPTAMLTFPRVVQTPVEISGQPLEPGTNLIGAIYLTHQREDVYPEPKQFRPERFLERQYSPYEFMPFGGGSRRCLGMALAQWEMKLILATILQRVTLGLTTAQSHTPLKPVRRGLLLAPEGDFSMIPSGLRQIPAMSC